MPGYPRHTDIGIVYDPVTRNVLRVVIPDPGEKIHPGHQGHGEGFVIRHLPAGADLSEFCRSLGFNRP